jgi:hypothetical protein
MSGLAPIAAVMLQCHVPRSVEMCHQPTSELAVRLLAASPRGLNRLGHPPPSVIRVKSRHARSDRVRARAEVLLVHVPMMTDEECHQAGNAILRRIGHEGEPASHLAAHHVLDFAARRIRPLPDENPIMVAILSRATLLVPTPRQSMRSVRKPTLRNGEV